MKVKINHSPNLNESEEIDLSVAARKGKEWTIGRAPDSDLILDSSDVSRLHAKFFFQAGNYYFCDLGSRNGSMYNNKTAEKNKQYILKDGDIIRIGDFVLVMEELLSLSDQAETVVRIINPSVFSNRRTTESVPPSVSPENVNDPNLANPILEVVEQAPQQVSSTSEEVELPEIINEEVSSDATFVQHQDTILQDEDVNQVPEVAEISADTKEHENQLSEVAETSSDTKEHEQAPTTESVMQPSESGSEPAQVIYHSEEQPEAPEYSDFTYIQPRDLHQPEETTEEFASSETPEVEEFMEYTIVQRQEPPAHPEEPTVEPAHPEEVAATHPEEPTVEPVHPEEVAATYPEEPTVEPVHTEEVAATSEIEELTSHEEELAEANIHQPQTEMTDISSEIIEEAVTGDEYPQSLAEKRIVLIAHESKKSELAEFVYDNQNFFSLCHTITWSSVSEVLQKEAGITISEQIPAATSGGYQTIAGSINSGDVSAVIFLRDFLQPQSSQTNEEAMLRLCNINQVLLATNIVTAEAIVYYLQHNE